ncbi:MAG TPA: PIN domain-containing protein [Thiotrichaceae bacterium]|nr:PIN domain-containing protein [Thiotrichaceae bacterium]
MIFLDTPILSVAYRRKYKKDETKPIEVLILQQLVAEHKPFQIPGIVVQEFLSGLREEAQFQKLRKLIEGFPIILANQHHHIEAAKIANVCRRNGIATSATDCLIAAMTIEQNAQLFTNDQDFVYMARHCPIRLFILGAGINLSVK